MRDNCTNLHAKKIHGGRHTEYRQTNGHVGRQDRTDEKYR
jgi:hypothetical protein